MNNNIGDNSFNNSVQNNDINNQTEVNENSSTEISDNNLQCDIKERKKEPFSIPVLVFIILCSIIIGIVVLSNSNVFDKTPKNEDIVTSEKVEIDKLNNEKSSDIYGYALMSYMPNQSEIKDYYKIVELHKSGNDKVIQSYDAVIKNAIDQVNRISINNAKIINNKLYYQLFFNYSNNGISTYSNIMYIDLSNKELETVELLKIKPDCSNINNSINSYKIYNDYIFYSTHESEDNYYKYDITTKETEESSKEEYDSIVEEIDSNYSLNGKYYYKGKEIKVNNLNEIVYNNDVIYTSPNKGLSLYYSFNDDLIFSELSDCEEKSCDTIKYYRLDIDTGEIEEIDYNKTMVFTTKIWYKK